MAGHRARRHTESLACRRHRLFVLASRHSPKHLRQEFLRKAPAILELLVGSQPDLTLRAPQSRVLDRELLVTDIDRPTLTRPFAKPGRRRMVVWPRSLFALHVHERLSYQASDIEHRGVQRSLALQHHMHNLIRPPLLLLRRPQHLCCILSLLRICSHRVAPFFLIASFDTDDLEGSHSPISTRFRISSSPSEAWWRTRSIVTKRSSGRRCEHERWRGNELNTELGARYSTRWPRSGCPIRTAPGDSATGIREVSDLLRAVQQRQCVPRSVEKERRPPLRHRCLRCLLLVMCTYPFAKKALTLHLARSEGHERYFGCNLMHRKVLALSHQHLMAEAPHRTGMKQPIMAGLNRAINARSTFCGAQPRLVSILHQYGVLWCCHG